MKLRKNLQTLMMSAPIAFLLWLTLLAVFKSSQAEFETSLKRNRRQIEQQVEDEWDSYEYSDQEDTMWQQVQQQSDDEFDDSMSSYQQETMSQLDESICELEKEVGPCRASITRYYFNNKSGKCEFFTYGGCRGNENNFKTLLECESSCKVQQQSEDEWDNYENDDEEDTIWQQVQQQSEDETENFVVADQQNILQQDSSEKEIPSRKRRADHQSLTRYKRQSPQCPTPQSPSPGSVMCHHGDGRIRKECTGTCARGYTFPNGRNRITLQCNTGEWFPYSTFPACTSSGECKIELKSSGSFSCNTNNRGKFCDIKCHGDRPIDSRFFCNPGQGWNPPLPYCVKRKGSAELIAAPSCNCQNGGTCDPDSLSCQCPPGFGGTQCEKRRAGSRQCGIEFTGASYKCDTNNYGFYCEIRCLSGEPNYGRYYCLSGEWSPPLPHCANKLRS